MDETVGTLGSRNWYKRAWRKVQMKKGTKIRGNASVRKAESPFPDSKVGKVAFDGAEYAAETFRSSLT